MSDITYASPSASILRGKVDAFLVLLLWIARRASWALVFTGVAIALWRGDVAAAFELDTVEEAIEAIRSPLAPLAFAFLFRFAVFFGGFLSALVVGTREVREVPELHDASGIRRIASVWRVTLAHRARRWTWPVRSLAVDELGRTGRVLGLIDRSFAVATIVAIVALVVVVFLQP